MRTGVVIITNSNQDFKKLVEQKQILPPDEEEGCVLQVIANSSPDQVFAAPSSENVQGMVR